MVKKAMVGAAQRMNNVIRKLKSTKFTVFVPIPRRSQKNTIGAPNTKKVGRLKTPITQRVAIRTTRFKLCVGRAARSLYSFTLSLVDVAFWYLICNDSDLYIIVFEWIIQSDTKYRRIEHKVISIVLENVRVAKTNITNELPSASNLVSYFKLYALQIL